MKNKLAIRAFLLSDTHELNPTVQRNPDEINIQNNPRRGSIKTDNISVKGETNPPVIDRSVPDPLESMVPMGRYQPGIPLPCGAIFHSLSSERQAPGLPPTGGDKHYPPVGCVRGMSDVL
jgi:hypothetical protein